MTLQIVETRLGHLLCNNVLDNTYYDHNIVPYRLSIQVATAKKTKITQEEN